MLTYQEIDAIWASNIPIGSTGTEWRRSVARAIEQAATAPLLAAIEDQKRTIIALNSAINGSGSTTTENLTIVDRLERRIAELEQAAKRVTDAFKAHGVSTPFTREADRTRHECEAAMLAIDATMKEQGHA